MRGRRSSSSAEERARLHTNRVLIVDDHDVLASALARALRSRHYVAETVAGPTPEAIVDAARRMAPVVVLLDLDLGPLGSGVDLVEPLLEAGGRVSLLSGTFNRFEVAKCVERGAVGVMPKATPLDSLMDQVDALASGEDLLSDQQRAMWLTELSRQRERLAPFERLTAREQAVLQLLMAGQPAEQIADQMFISLPTVRSHIKSVLRKLQVRSQLAAVALAHEAGWTGPASVR